MAKRPTRDTAGRPPLWESPKALQTSIDEYYKFCDENDRPYTIAGLASFLNIDRQTVYNYCYKDKFIDTIKKARDKIMARLEEIAISKGNAGTIFVMKNYGYVDKQEIDNKLSGSISYESNLKELKGEKM